MSSVAAFTPHVAPPSATVAKALDAVAAGEILSAVAAAELLRRPVATDERVAGALIRLIDDGDRLAAMLSLHALSAAPGRAVENTLVSALDECDLREQALWALARRTPVDAAIPALARIVAEGDFPAMPAQVALEQWSARAGERVGLEIRRALAACSTGDGWSRLVETLSLVNHPEAARTLDGLHRARTHRAGDRLSVAQILLRGRVDAELEVAGSGDGGGVVTVLVQLARELGRRPDVEKSLIIARPRDPARTIDEPLGPGASITRLPFGPIEQVPVSEMWEHRVQIERALAATLAAEPIDVAHLRYADASTFAAARALRRAGVRTVFTLAPDPHGLIAEAERTRRLTRGSFAEAESREHNLFRLRLVDELTARADQVVTLPRAGGHAELERLVGRRLVPRRTASIPEGISLDPLERALDAVSRPKTDLPPIASDLVSSVAALGDSRFGLPLIISVGRFHPVKGFPRLVEAWGDDPTLVARFNLVLVGGDLDRPSAEERAVISEIDRVAGRHPAVRSGLLLLGSRPHEDIAHLLAIGRHGLGDAVAPAGVYACASAKEEFGVAILEALASGLAVVAPAGGGPDSYLEPDSGVLVEPGRVDTLRAGLYRAALLADDEDRAGRAAALVRERFAIEPMASALAEIYSLAADPR